MPNPDPMIGVDLMLVSLGISGVDAARQGSRTAGTSACSGRENTPGVRCPGAIVEKLGRSWRSAAPRGCRGHLPRCASFMRNFAARPIRPMTASFTHGGLTIAHRTTGSGPVHVLAFHGYGGSVRDLDTAAAAWGDRVTLHAFDLWFHGGSRFPQGRTVDEPITPGEWRDLLRAYLDARGIDRAWYAGFSLGGRMALGLLEQLPGRSAGLLLFAPDGLVRNPWYRALSRTRLGRHLYRRFLQRPGGWFSVVHAAHRTGLISARFHRFLTQHTDQPAKRQLVHDVWLSLRAIEPDLGRVVGHLRAHDLHAHLYMGRFDRVIRLPWGRSFARRDPGRIHLRVVEQGHLVMVPTVLHEIPAHLGWAQRKKGA